MTPTENPAEETASKSYADETGLTGLTERAQLRDVRTVKIHAVSFRVPVANEAINSRSTLTKEFRRSGSELDIRFRVRLHLSSESGSRLAELETAFITSFEVADPDDTDDEMIPQFIDRVAMFIVFPFIREQVQAMSVRIGLPPLTLGLLKADSDDPIPLTLRADPENSGPQPAHGKESGTAD